MLATSIGMDCAAAMTAITQAPGFSGDVCDLDLTTWLNHRMAIAQICRPHSCVAACSAGGGR